METIFAGTQSITGNYREKNQDRIVCLLTRKNTAENFGVACVCDGIGSFAESEIAAQLVTDGIALWYEGKKRNYRQNTEEELVMDLENTLQELNELVYEYQQENEIKIGCTMSLVLLIGKKYYIFHVGDSRICLVRQEIYQLTLDEVRQYSKDRKIKSYLANYIGKRKELWMNKGTGKLPEDGILVLGSDGFFEKLKEDDFWEVRKMRCSDNNMKKAAEKLIAKVLERGERDNVSCILLRLRKTKHFGAKEYRVHS